MYQPINEKDMAKLIWLAGDGLNAVYGCDEQTRDTSKKRTTLQIMYILLYAAYSSGSSRLYAWQP